MTKFNHLSGRHETIDGALIYYEKIENPGKPVLLMLHGGFETIESLNPIVNYLSKDFTIISVDSRGHGKSTLGQKKLTYAQIQMDIETLLRRLLIDTVSIIGFSDGGVVGYRIAAHKLITVEKLVAIGSSWSTNDIIVAEELYKSVTPESAREMFLHDYEMYNQLNPQPDFETFSKALVEMWIDKSESGHPNDQVKDITSSTLLIRGDNDFLVSLESLAELKGKIGGSALCNVPFAQHVVFEEQPKVVEVVLKEFLLNSNPVLEK